MADDTRVIDGDTLVAPGGERVRLYGVDTPEITKRTGEENQPGGLEAKLATEHLIQDGYTLGESQGETYGRSVRDALTDNGRSVSNSLLENGLASVPGNRDFSDAQHRVASLGALFPRRDEDPTIKALRDSAQESRKQRLLAFAQGARNGTLMGMAGSYVPNEGTVSRAWDRGVAELKATGNGFLTAVGDLTGIDALSESGRAGLSKAMIEALENPAEIASYEDVDSLSEAGTYALETLVSTSPGLISDAALAALGAATGGGTVALAGVGKAFLRSAGGAAAVGQARSLTAKAGAKAGAKLGAGSSMYAQNTGETQMGFMREDIDNPGAALSIGAAKTALDYVSLKGTLGDTMDAGGDTLLDTFKSIGKATRDGSVREGFTEGLQSDIDERGKEYLAENGYTYDERNVIEGVVAGTLVGGTLSGSGASVTGLARQIGNADRAAPTDGESAEAPADSPDAPTTTRTRQWNDGVPTPDSPIGTTAAEPPSDLIAQAADRGFTYASPENMSDGASAQAVIDALGSGSVVRQLPNGGAYIGTDAETIASLPESPTEQEQADILGYDAPKTDDVENSVAVRELDDNGAVLKSQMASTERAPALIAEAESRGRRAEAIPITEEVSQRQQRYAADMEALNAGRPADLAPQVTQFQSEPEAEVVESPVAEVERNGPNRPFSEIAEQARGLGIETSRYAGTEQAVDTTVLRHSLQSRMREAMPGNENVTLRERLGGRRMAELSDAEVLAVAEEMGVAELPPRLGRVTEGESRLRSTAIASIVTKVGQLARGSRQGLTNESEAVFAPGNLDALTKLLPELEGLNREDSTDRASFDADVRRALPTSMVKFRKRLAKLDSAELYQATQLLRTGYKIPDGVSFEFENVAKPQSLGSAITALSPTRDQAPAPAPEVSRAAPGFEPNADANRPGLSADLVLEEGEGDAHIEAAKADATVPQVEDEDIFGESPELTAALIGSAYAALTGDGNGATTRAVMRMAYPNMDETQLANADVTRLSGRRALDNLEIDDLSTSELNARRREWQQMAIDNPRQFVDELSQAFILKGTKATDFQTVAPSTQSDSSKNPSGEPQATGINGGPNVAAGMDGNGVQYEGGIEASEQEASEGLFFNGVIEGSRFVEDENGVNRPAGKLDEEAANSRAPHTRQRFTSNETTQRLKGANLAPLTFTTPNGSTATQNFDVVALAAHPQSGMPRPSTPTEALDNLTANLSRMILGPTTEKVGREGDRPSKVQQLAPDTVVPPSTVIFETEDGRPVTYGEALATTMQQRDKAGEAAKVANRSDALRETQAARRQAMRPLISRVLGAMDSMTSEERVATAADLDTIMANVDNDQLEDGTPSDTFMRSLSQEEQQAFATEVRSRVGALQQGVKTMQDRLAAAREEQAQLDAELIAAQGVTKELTQAARNAAAYEVRNLERGIETAQKDVALMQRRVADLPTTAVESVEPGKQSSAPKVNRSKSRISRFSISDKQAEALGLGDARTLDTLATQYRNGRNQLFAMSKVLQDSPRTSSDVEMSVDTVARELTNAGMDYDAARMAAEQYVERSGSILADAEDDVVIRDDMEPSGDVMVGGVASQLAVNEDGSITESAMPTVDAEEASGNAAANDAAAAEEQAARRKINQTKAEHDAKIEAFKAANPERFKEKKAPDTPMRPGTMSLYSNPLSIPTLPNARARSQLHERAIKNAIHGTLPTNPRPAILQAVFGNEGVHVRGTESSAEVSDFVQKAAADFRSTDRPVLVMVGEDAGQISRFLEEKQLVTPNKRKQASRLLADAGAGRKALYMPMGDFLLVSMPTQPKHRVSNLNGKDSLRWYHKLGHELGHMVYDDYAMSLESNKAMRDIVTAGYQNDTGLVPNDDPALFKEWFADKAANEMLNSRSRESQQAAPITPFTRLANLMAGLFERLQYMIPRYTRSAHFAQFAAKIRDGQVQRDRGLATPDFQTEAYDGPAGNRAAMAAQRVKNNVGKIKSPDSLTRRVFGTVVGRMEAYNEELGQRLFQRSASDRNGRTEQSWQQLANSIRDRNVGAFARASAQLTAGMKKKDATAAIRQALLDLEAGKRTKGAEIMATLIDSAITDAEAKGLRSVSHPQNFVPAALNHMNVDKDRAKFQQIMKSAFPNDSDAKLNERTNLLLDNHGMSEYAIAPGLPVSMHETTRVLMDVARPELRAAGFLAEPSEAVLYHWMDGLAKRTAWEANFGDYSREVSNIPDENRRLMGIDDPQGTEARRRGLMDENGRYFDPNGRFNKLVDQASADHGMEARKEILAMLDGVMGRTTSAMPRKVRNVNDWVTAWTGWTVLAFSGVASIPELGLGYARAHGRVTPLEGIKSIGEAKRYAKDMGIVLGDSAEQIMWQSMGDNYESPLLNKMGTAFFKYNGQKAVTDASRIMSTSVAMQYLKSSAEVGDAQALEQLGVTAADVRAWDNAGRPAWQPGVDTADNAVAEKVGAAINQFVYEGSTMPSKLQNPGWFNNPWLKAVWMIKRYMYAYGEGILGGMYRQTQRQWKRGSSLGGGQRAFLAAAPALSFAAATLPLAAAGTELREWIQGRDKSVDDYGGWPGYAKQMFSRAGGFGPLELVLNAKQQADWGASPIGAISPVASKVEMWFDWGKDDAVSWDEFKTKAVKSTPVLSQLPNPIKSLFD